MPLYGITDPGRHGPDAHVSGGGRDKFILSTCICNSLNSTGTSVTDCLGYAGCPPIFHGRASARSFPGEPLSSQASSVINGFMGCEGGTIDGFSKQTLPVTFSGPPGYINAAARFFYEANWNMNYVSGGNTEILAGTSCFIDLAGVGGGNGATIRRTAGGAIDYPYGNSLSATIVDLGGGAYQVTNGGIATGYVWIPGNGLQTLTGYFFSWAGTSAQPGNVSATSSGQMWLPCSGPVFVLPPGYTANCPAADIVNNQWVGGVHVTKPTAQGFLNQLVDVVQGVQMQSVPDRATLVASGMTSIGGPFDVTDNAALTTLSAPLLAHVGGSMTVSGNPSVTSVDFPALTTVTGNLTIETPIQSTVDFAGVAVGGNIDVSSTNATSVAVDAPGGTTSVEMTNGAASVDADLPDDAAPAGTPFAVLQVSGAGLDPQAGLDASGAPATVDPVTAYAFTLGGTLAAPASLVFDVILANLSPAEQTAVLDAYVAGKLTLTVQSDAPGSLPQARAQCGPSDPLIADGCVKVAAFDALGFELTPGVTAGAVKLRIAALVSHFSTYAVSILSPAPRVAGDANCDGLVDGGDIGAFVLAIMDSGTYTTAHPGCNLLNSDSNIDTTVNAGDIEPFVNCLINGVCP